MTDKITKKMLYGALKVLNCETQLNYQLEPVLNGWNLYHMQEQSSYGTIVCYASSTRDMFDKIHAIRTLLLMEHQNKPTEYEKQTKQEIKASGYPVWRL